MWNIHSVAVLSLVAQLCLTLCDPMGSCSPPGSSVQGILQASIPEWAAFPFSRGSPQPRDGTQVSSFAGGFFTAWATREAQSESVSDSALSDSATPRTVAARFLCPWDSPGKNTGVGCYAFLQGIFLTQGLNLGLPHCGQILYRLSH